MCRPENCDGVKELVQGRSWNFTQVLSTNALSILLFKINFISPCQAHIMRSQSMTTHVFIQHFLSRAYCPRPSSGPHAFRCEKTSRIPAILNFLYH